MAVAALGGVGDGVGHHRVNVVSQQGAHVGNELLACNVLHVLHGALQTGRVSHKGLRDVPQ